MKSLFGFAVSAVTLSLIITGCELQDDQSSAPAPAPVVTSNSYASTSTKGDFAQWTITNGLLNGTWEIVDGSGLVAKVLNVSATCAAADATYGYQTCTISEATCTDEAQACQNGDAPAVGSTFNIFEVPGTALFVQATGGGTQQLHVGFALDTSCTGVTGDYSYLHLGNDQRDLFGLFRTNSDMSQITHADFQMSSATCSAGSVSSGNCTASDTAVSYSTGNGTGNGIDNPAANGCINGVRTLSMSFGIARAMQSQSGVFMIDLPSGSGGILAFNTSKAATLADLSNINFGGIVFPDSGSPKLMAGSIGALAGSGSSATAPISSLSFNDNSAVGITSPFITAAANATSTATNAPYADFTVAPQGSYVNNSLQATYSTPSAIPGLFRVDGAFSDGGRILMMVTKYNGKVLGFGTVYNWRNPADSNFSSLTQGTGYYNSGAFIMFQK